MRIICSVIVMLVGAAAPALAEDLPRFDIQGFCAANAGARGDLVSCQRTEETKRLDIAQRRKAYLNQTA